MPHLWQVLLFTGFCISALLWRYPEHFLEASHTTTDKAKNPFHVVNDYEHQSYPQQNSEETSDKASNYRVESIKEHQSLHLSISESP